MKANLIIILSLVADLFLSTLDWYIYDHFQLSKALAYIILYICWGLRMVTLAGIFYWVMNKRPVIERWAKNTFFIYWLCIIVYHFVWIYLVQYLPLKELI